MTSRLFKILVLLAITSLVAGCKLAVIVPSGGDVTSLSGTRNCAGGSLCEHNITDSTFNESFTAVARPGYVFTKWNSGNGFFCGNSTNPTCTITNVATAGIAGFEAVIATGQLFYAMPLFEFVGIDTDGDGEKDHIDKDDDNDGVEDGLDNCPLLGPNGDGYGCPISGTPITDTVFIDGKEWAQVDLFVNLSWNDINTACAAGPCSGVLKGYSMAGWTWASLDDVNALFNYYIGASIFGPGASVTQYDELGSAWGPRIFLDGMRPTFLGDPLRQQLFALSRSTLPNDPDFVWRSFISDSYPSSMLDSIYHDISSKSQSFSGFGGWFYRDSLP